MGTLKCGAGIRDITPPLDIIHGLRGLMGCKYGGIHDELKVRAIAFENGEKRALIVQLDLDKDQAPHTQLDIISQRWNVPVENILYFGIHTHAAPMFSGRHELGNPDEEILSCTHKYEDLVFSAMYEAIDDAFNSLREAKIGCGKQDCYVNVRRVEDFYSFGEDGSVTGVTATQGSDPAEPMSHEFFVMRVNDMEDKPIAFLMNYPMHCVVMFLNGLAEDGTNLISGDVAGNLSQLIEKRYPGSVAVWSSGAAGDANPLPNSFGTYVDPLTGKLKNFELLGVADKLLEYVTAKQFTAAMKAINSIKYYSAKSEILGFVDWSRTPCYKTVADPETGRRSVDTTQIEPEGYEVRMQMLRIGDVQFIGMGGELFNSFAEDLKSISPVKNTVVINHNCSLLSSAGYILDDNAIGRNYGLRPGGKPATLPGYLTESFRKIFYKYLAM